MAILDTDLGTHPTNPTRGSVKVLKHKDVKQVALFPVRYALGDDPSRTPKVSGPFQVADASGAALPAQGATHYTLRRPRSGYLYVFQEKEQAWNLYKVGADSALSRLVLTEAQAGDLRHIPMGLVMAPEDSPLWFGFSDARWTARTLDKAASDAAFRKRHMRRVDPAAWKGPHAAPLSEAGNHVADMAKGISPGAFWFSRDPFTKLSKGALETGVPPEALSRGAIIALEDPAGVAMDLATMMLARHEAWLLEPDPKCPGHTTKWALFTASAIGSLKESVATQAEYSEYEAEIKNRDQAIMDSGGSILWFESTRKLYSDEAIDKRLAARAQQTRKESWEKYLAKYDNSGMEAWQTTYNDRLKAFDQTSIQPLAKMHVAWAESQRFKAYFDGCFDSQDPVSGWAYTATLARCYEGVQDKGPCANHMLKALEASLDAKNVLLRGLVLNQKSVAESIQEAAKPSVDLRDLPWDGLITGFGEVAKSAGTPGETALGRFIAMLGGPVASLLQKALDGPVRHGLVALGVASQTPIVRIEAEGSRKAFRAQVVKTLMDLHKGKVGEHQIHRAVAAEMKRLEIHGVPMEGTHKHAFLAMVDPGVVEAMPKGLKPQAQAEWLAKSIRTAEQVESLNLSSWQSKVKNVMGGKGFPLVFGTVTGILQFVSMGKLSEDLDKAMGFEKADAQVRRLAGMGAFAGTVADVVGTALESRATGVFSTATVGRGLRLMGRLAGFATGLVVAVMDGVKGADSWRGGDKGLAVAYFASAVFGAGAAICFFATAAWAGPVGWLLIVLAIGIAVLIEFIKDNKLQEWLKRCCFGKMVQEQYPSMNVETKQLQLAMG